MFYVPLAAVEEEEGQQGQDGDDDERLRDEDGATGVARPPVVARVEDGSNVDRVVKERCEFGCGDDIIFP